MKHPKERIRLEREEQVFAAYDDTPDPIIPVQGPAMGAASRSAILLFAANFIFSLAYNSQIVKFAGEHTFEYVNRSFYIVAIAGVVVGFVLQEFLASLAALALFAYFGAMAIVGSENSPLGLINSIFLPYAPLAMAPLAAYLMRQGRGQFIETIIKCAAIVYFLLYIYFSHTVTGDASRTKSGAGFIVSSGGRGARLAIDTAGLTAAYFLALAGIRSGKQLALNGLILLLGCVVLYLSDSRLLTVMMVLVSVAFIIMPGSRILDYGAAAGFALASGVMLYLLATGQNIYALLSSDNSALARMQELNSIRQSMDQGLITGHGFFTPGSIDPTKGTDYTRDIFWNDMGIYGILFATGVVGLVIFILMSVRFILSRSTFDAAGQPRTLTNGLGLACVICGTLGFTAPFVWTNGLELVALVVAAMVVAAGRGSVRRTLIDARRGAPRP